MEDALSKIRSYVEAAKSFEVSHKDGQTIIEEFKGIKKGVEISKKELKGVRIGRKKIPKDQLQLILNVAERLLDKAIDFKVVFGQNDSTIRFDLDHYVHLYPDKCVAVGFLNNSEEPLSLIYDLLAESYGKVQLLSPKK
ncbi:MAG: hypothetical protein DRJ31_07035 [Candidatus Methanomethylicota archaeon]|uniref:Uncharacterized protein n=2 Tax=Thermoproteota archaeon TaxID=2056631 RepID=A0A497EMY9_9CREN|nr:MAG: hypothetical protein DRJ31_07035 [Candidatus Verstraetearchaeota archaeon]